MKYGKPQEIMCLILDQKTLQGIRGLMEASLGTGLKDIAIQYPASAKTLAMVTTLHRTYYASLL
jgi:hypothetical protein